MQPSRLSGKHQGFTLVELAIVLVIVAMLTGGLLMGITAQRISADNTDAQRQLDNIRETLLGYAMVNGRLPCPANPLVATAGGGGDEELKCDIAGCPLPTGAPAGTPPDKTCTLEFGVLPWKTLGLSENDPWGNRFTYFVGIEFSKPLSWAEYNKGMRVRFSIITAGRANIEDGAGNTIASKIPAVIVSHGSRNFGAYQSSGNQIPGAAGDELENANSTLTFVSHVPGSNFDDLVTWIAPGILMAKMVAAGRLP